MSVSLPHNMLSHLRKIASHCAGLVLIGPLAACGTSPDKVCESPYAQSPQYQGCGFRNMDNPDVLPQQSMFNIYWRMLTEAKVGTVPVDAIPMKPLSRAQLDALDGTRNHVVRLGHSSHLLKLRGSYWLIDPVFSERTSPLQWIGPKRFHPSPIALPELPDIDGLVLSHDHYDHLDTATIKYLSAKVKHYFVPLGVGRRLQGMGVAPERITELDWWQTRTDAPGGVTVTATPAQHFSGRTLTDRNETLWASWVLQSGDQRIFYSGDSGYFPGFKQIGARFGGFDLALMENGAYDSYWPAVHMTPEQTLQAFQDVKGKTLYGVHNSTFDLAFHRWQDPLERLSALAERHGVELATPLIGEVLTVGQARSNVLWWKGLR